MEETSLINALKERFGDTVVGRGTQLADGGVRLSRDHRMTNPAKGTFGDYGVAAISRSESKVEFDLESLQTQCLSCGLARGTICHHVVAVLVAANRQSFLTDDELRKMIGSLYGVRERGSQVARRICPSCRKPLEITSQIVCPKCGRAVCRDCYLREEGMCSKCHDVKVHGKPKVGLGEVLKGFIGKK